MRTISGGRKVSHGLNLLTLLLIREPILEERTVTMHYDELLPFGIRFKRLRGNAPGHSSERG